MCFFFCFFFFYTKVAYFVAVYSFLAVDTKVVFFLGGGSSDMKQRQSVRCQTSFRRKAAEVRPDALWIWGTPFLRKSPEKDVFP